MCQRKLRSLEEVGVADKKFFLTRKITSRSYFVFKMKRVSRVILLLCVKFYSDAARRFQTAICVTDSIAVLFAKSKYGACTA
jgi:hypothetical protein